MAKRTYSSMDKRLEEQRRKRQKSDGDDELRWPGNSSSGRPSKSTSLIKKQFKKYGGPVSIPDEDSDTASRVTDGHSVLDKALTGKLKQVERKQDNIHGSREDFENTMHNQKKRKSSEEGRTQSYLPTPPVEIQKQQHQPANQFVSSMKPPAANTPTQVATPAWMRWTQSKTQEKPLGCEESRQPYVPKQFEADKPHSPRRDLAGGRLSSKSKEAKLWSTNQSNSPFLRLPAEIRNQIYEDALGFQTIHIGYETYRSSYVESKPVFRYRSTVFNHITNPFKERQQPYIKVSKGFTLLNNICRQMYLETAVLPYKLSTIAFDSHNIMINFLLHEQRLSRPQRHGLKQIVVRHDLPAANMLTYLPNLERVFLGGQQAHSKPSGWYMVVRPDGEKPKLVRK